MSNPLTPSQFPGLDEVLLVVGSLRHGSLNARLAEVIADELSRRAPGVRVESADVGSVPLYNSDIDIEPKPDAVNALDDRIRSADLAVWITPVYNAGVSGVLKNALDWASRPAFAGSLAGSRAVVASATIGGHPPTAVLESLALSLGLCAADVAPQFLAVTEAMGLVDADSVSPELQAQVADWVDALADWWTGRTGGDVDPAP